MRGERSLLAPFPQRRNSGGRVGSEVEIRDGYTLARFSVVQRQQRKALKSVWNRSISSVGWDREWKRERERERKRDKWSPVFAIYRGEKRRGGEEGRKKTGTSARRRVRMPCNRSHAVVFVKASIVAFIALCFASDCAPSSGPTIRPFRLSGSSFRRPPITSFLSSLHFVLTEHFSASLNHERSNVVEPFFTWDTMSRNTSGRWFLKLKVVFRVSKIFRVSDVLFIIRSSCCLSNCDRVDILFVYGRVFHGCWINWIYVPSTTCHWQLIADRLVHNNSLISFCTRHWTRTLDRNYWEVRNLSFVLPILFYSNIFKDGENIAILRQKILDMRHSSARCWNIESFKSELANWRLMDACPYFPFR